jgi:Flp pilus assembly pilin Flp
MVNFVRSLAARLHANEAGQGLVEYALIMALVVFAAVTTMRGLASEINLAFSQITSSLNSSISPPPAP